jgi:hypothetical protein
MIDKNKLADNLHFAVTAKYVPASDRSGSKVKAECVRGEITLPWCHSLTDAENHQRAIIAILVCLGWNVKRSWSFGWDNYKRMCATSVFNTEAESFDLDYLQLTNDDLRKFKSYDIK